MNKPLRQSLRENEDLFLYRMSRIRRLIRLANTNSQSDAAKQVKRYVRIIKMFKYLSNKLCSALFDAELDKELAEASVRDLETILFGRNLKKKESKK